MGVDHMRKEFTGGLSMPESVRIFPPWIRLIATPERLQFQPRFGLNRIFDGWTLEREQITSVLREPRGLDPFHNVGISGEKGLWWTFFTYRRPEEVLVGLEELGYPMQPTD